MKRIHLLLIICLALAVSQCQKELSHDFPSGENKNANPVTATLQGNVLDENGQPAIGVTIRVGAKTTTTNAKGYFRIVHAALDKYAALVTAEKNGYFKAYRSFQATSGVNQVVIKLLVKKLAGSIAASSGGDVTLPNGAKISLQAGGFVNKLTGVNYSGNVNVYATYIDPSASDITSIVPGSWIADDINKNRVVLTSMGMMAVELQSASGEVLQLAADKPATLNVPIPASLQAFAPVNIPLWYLDETSGVWKEEGSATRSGDHYTGTVKHFSFWNCDVPTNAINLSLTLQTPSGQVVPYTSVKITRPNGNYAYGFTDSLGAVSGMVPANENLVIEVMASPCNTVIYTQNAGPFSQNTNMGVIIVPATSPNLVNVTGTLLNCSGAPVTNGYAIITYDNVVHYAATDNNGHFATIVLTCSPTYTTCEILGVDQSTQQQGAVYNVVLAPPVTQAGNIQACGNSSLQFINYTMDGVQYAISSLVATDIISDATIDSNGHTTTYITGSNGNANGINFFFVSATTVAGSYPLQSLYQAQYAYVNTVQPFDVTITNFPANNSQFYEGSFAGQFTEFLNPAAVHTISCSFRVRRQ
jgi:hypothetical protein